MISGVTKEISGKSYTFCLKNKAKRKADQLLRQEGEPSFMFIVQDMATRASHQFLTAVVAASMNDGNGGSMEDADDIIDAIESDEAFGELVIEIVTAAFPEAKGQASKNPKRAARSK